MITPKAKYLVPQRVFIFEFTKRLIDIVGSLFLLILFSPILIVTAILVKRSSPGPILFKQPRIGKNGRNFYIFKFRTMLSGDNDKLLKEKYPDLWKRYIKTDWKLLNDEDPRITPIGRRIRSLTIDEFPQLWNVLRGEMSLVGHRPYRDVELDGYRSRYPEAQKYIDIIKTAKPGITGLWQISGRNDIPFEKRAELDAKYIQTRSFRQEILILLKTPLAMLSRW